MNLPPEQAAGLPLTTPLTSLAWLERHFSVPLVFALVALATFFIAWNRGVALLYALFALLVGAALFSAIGPRLMLRPATIRLRLPRQAAVGDGISAGISILPQRWPYRRHLLQIRSPYPFAPAQHVFLPLCDADTVHEQRVLCVQRGVFQLAEAAVASAYPLGLVTLARRWLVEPAWITIYPRVYPVITFSLPASSDCSADMERPAPSLGQELFREVRDYRRGDNPRHIHWRSSARRGQLVVKQFDAMAASETWIVLDLDPAGHAGQGADHSFERAVEIAATIATHLIRSGLRCGIAGGVQADGSPLLLVPPRTGNAHLQAVMDALAAVQANAALPYADVLDALAGHYRAGQQWILFRHGDERVSSPGFLRNQRPAFWFRFDTQSFADVDFPRTQLMPPLRQSDGILIARDTDLLLVF